MSSGPPAAPPEPAGAGDGAAGDGAAAVGAAEAAVVVVETTVSSFLLQPARAASAASEPQPATLIQERFMRVMGSPVGTQKTDTRGCDEPSCRRELSTNAVRHPHGVAGGTRQPPGKNGLPIDAGMLMRMNDALREISSSPAIVARRRII